MTAFARPMAPDAVPIVPAILQHEIVGIRLRLRAVQRPPRGRRGDAGRSGTFPEQPRLRAVTLLCG